MSVTYSFLDVVASFSGPTGNFALTGGSAKEGITIAMAEDKNNMLIGADGSVQHSLRANNGGEITIRLLKNSTTNAVLSGMYNAQKLSSTLWGQNVITINSAIGDEIVATSVAFKKQPSVTYAEDGGINEWTFDVGSITEILAASII